MTQALTLICNPQNPQLDDVICREISNQCGGNDIKWLNPGIACDISLSNVGNGPTVRKTASDILAGKPVDIIIQSAENRRKKILIADMDSTIIAQECIDELAMETGNGAKVAAITERAMNGEIDFSDALRERVALMAGLSENVIKKVLADCVTINPGAKELVSTLRTHGAFCALVSGGFTAFSREIAAAVGFNETHANELIITDGVLTGKVHEPVLGKEAKVERLDEFCARLSLTRDDAMSVGDGANDLPMLKAAGSGIAYHAKPAVAAQCENHIEHGDLTALLYAQGYHIDEFSSGL